MSLRNKFTPRAMNIEFHWLKYCYLKKVQKLLVILEKQREPRTWHRLQTDFRIRRFLYLLLFLLVFRESYVEKIVHRALACRFCRDAHPVDERNTGKLKHSNWTWWDIFINTPLTLLNVPTDFAAHGTGSNPTEHRLKFIQMTLKIDNFIVLL